MLKTRYLLCLLLFSIKLTAQNNELLFSPQGIAEIHITLANGKDISDIKNEKESDDYTGKVQATMTVVNSSQSTYPTDDFYTGKILIDGRGNTSWHHEKRPYNIDLVDTDWVTEVEARLLGMPPGDEWCLLAFWEDRSLMRYQLAYYLGQNMSGISWVPRNRYVEVWINNDYRGLYALTEKIQRDKNRIDVKKLDETSTDLTGGYILEGSSPEKLKPIDQQVQFRTAQDDINFTFKYPKPQNVTTQQRAYIKSYIDSFEYVLRQPYFANQDTGYYKYIDVESFIDWTILYELSKGCDNLFHASIFVHKDKGGKLNMSAPWDFDLSFGNSGIFTTEGTWVRSHRWFNLLYRDPVYAQRFNDRFNELMPLLNTIPEVIAANYEQLENSGVLEREYDRFPSIINDYMNKDGSRFTPNTYQGHALYLSQWFMARKDWVYIDIAPDNAEKSLRLETIKPVVRVMNPEYFENGNTAQLKVMRSEENINKFKYSWNDGPFLGDWYRSITQKGKYWVKIKDQSGHISLTSDTIYFGVDAPSDMIPEQSGEFAFTYTNPAKDRITINLFSAMEGLTVSVSLWDIRGTQVLYQELNYTVTYEIQLPVSDLQRGMYILCLKTNKGIFSKKVILNL